MRATARRLLYAASIAAVLAGCATSVASGGAAPTTSMVKIEAMDGSSHGSGVSIGGGMFLTAAHVVEGQKSVALHNEFGVVLAANVLWVNAEYDIAALRMVGDADRPFAVESALDCRTPLIGESVMAAGNPGAEDGIFLPATVVGGERTRGNWTSIIPIASAVSPGSSGGPLYDVEGDVVGIVVGVQLAPLTIDKEVFVTMTGLAYVVPASAICGLLGREAM